MKDDGYKAILASVLLLNQEAKQKSRCIELLNHLKEILYTFSSKHEVLLQECLNYQVYMLEVRSQLSSHENIIVSITDDESYRQHTMNQGEMYKFELGPTPNYKLKFAVARMNGENKKAVVRSSSFLKRVMSIDRKENESILLRNLVVDTTETKCIAHRGHCYFTDITLRRETRHELVPTLKFEDLLEFTRTLHEWEACTDATEYTGELGDLSFSLLHLTTTYHAVPPIVLKIITLSVFLVWDYSLRGLDDGIVPRLIQNIKQQEEIEGNSQLVQQSLSHLSQCVQGEMVEVLERFQQDTLFPPSGPLLLKKINVALKTVVDICVLPLWDHNSSVDPSVVLSEYLESMLRDSANEWVTEQFQTEREDIKETCLLIQSMWEAMEHNYQSSNLFFHQFNINFVQVTISAIDEKLESFSRAYISNRLASLDSRSPEQLELFSKCTMRFYETISSISKFSLQNRVENLRLHGYEDWFLGVTVFWTYSWRQISLKMVERTICLVADEDDSKSETRRPLPAGLYSFLCIQKGISDDYSMLSFQHPENVLMATVSLVHIFCENVCAYSKKLFHECMRSEDELYRLACGVNGVEQSMDYIHDKWRKFVNWETQREILTPEERVAIERAAASVMSSTKRRCDQLMSIMVTRFCNSFHDDVIKIARSISLDSTEYTNTFKSYMRDITPVERVHATLQAVDELTDQVRKQLLPRAYKMSLSCLFNQLEEEITKQLKKAQPPEYYGNVYVTLTTILEFLELPPDSCPLTSILHYKSYSTDELMLSYYSHLCDVVERTEDTHSPLINMQMSCLRAAGDNRLIVVKVVDMANFPVLNPLYDRMDPFVKLQLLPRSIFPEQSFQPQRTKILTHCRHRPVWRQEFHFLVPNQLFYTNGATLCISVLDHDRICDQLLGRAFVAVSRIPVSAGTYQMTSSLTLLQPSAAHTSPFYQMLRDRAAYDRVARSFISHEQTARDMVSKVKRLSCKISRKNKCF